jgi:F-type H+-transporting ATPase subunit gamma
MQKLLEVRKRTVTVRSIRSLASTMATVASAKLSRTRERAAGMRVYAERMRGVVRRQQAAAAALGIDLVSLSPFLQPHPEVRRVLLLHVAGDRGMCGAYNSAIDRVADSFVRKRLAGGVEVSAIAKGLKGEKFLRRRTKAAVLEAAGWPRAGVTAEEIDALAERLWQAFLTGEADEVWCTYTRFYSPLRHYPTVVRLLPLSFEGAATAEPTAGGEAEQARRWFYEPDLATILTELLGIFLRLQIEDVLLESYASEQGARMITMEEATERADRSLQELTVAYNRLRREVITTDLLGVLFASALREAEHTGSTGEA